MYIFPCLLFSNVERISDLNRLESNHFAWHWNIFLDYIDLIFWYSFLIVCLHKGNIQDCCILSLIYSAGLCRGELLNLKLKGIDSDRILIGVENSKGGRNRYTLLSKNILKDLRIYYQLLKANMHLFEGEKGGEYSDSSITNIIPGVTLKTKIRKK